MASLPSKGAHLQYLSVICLTASKSLTGVLTLLQVADFATLVGTYARGFAIITEPFDQRMENVRDPVMQVRHVSQEETTCELHARAMSACDHVLTASSVPHWCNSRQMVQAAWMQFCRAHSKGNIVSPAWRPAWPLLLSVKLPGSTACSTSHLPVLPCSWPAWTPASP